MSEKATKALRSTGSATIAFGMVSVPVKLYTATEARAKVEFNMLHAGCGSRLKQQYVCAKDGAVVPRESMVKGYEFTKDRFITFSPEEMKSLEAIATEAVEILEFVDVASIDPVFYDKAYYLAPDKGAARAYALLAAAMMKTGKGGIARYASRGKEHLVLLRPVAGGIIMQTLHFADEVRAIGDLPIDEAVVDDRMLTAAVQLVDAISAPAFKPTAFEDSVKKRTLAAIAAKSEGSDMVLAAPAAAAPVIDLMAALTASLNAKKAA